jgi:hypothetical protein
MFVHPDKTLSADISDLSSGGHKQVFDRIFPDSCDDGFTLVSHKTGQEVRMYVTRTVRDKEGDITHWCMKSDPDDELRLHLPAAIELTIFND